MDRNADDLEHRIRVAKDVHVFVRSCWRTTRILWFVAAIFGVFGVVALAGEEAYGASVLVGVLTVLTLMVGQGVEVLLAMLVQRQETNG